MPDKLQVLIRRIFDEKSLHRIVFLASFITVMAPILAGFIFQSHSRYYLDSILQINTSKYFTDFFHNGSLFFGGNYSTEQIRYFPLMALLYLFQLYFSPAVAFFILIFALYFISFFSFASFFLSFSNSKTFLDRMLISLMGVLFYSSLSFYVYIQYGLTSFLPYLILMPLLTLWNAFLRDGRAKNLFFLLMISLFLAPLNATYVLLIWLFLNLYTCWFSIHEKQKIFFIINKAIILNLFLSTALLLALFPTFISIVRGGSEGLGLIEENFYSRNADYVNIITQRTDWAFFEGFKGEKYYSFANYYENGPVLFFGFLPYFLLILLFILVRKSEDYRSIFFGFFLLFLFIFFLMLGLNNPFYRLFYDNFPGFQVFRNITKFAPLLFFLLLFLIFSLYLDIRGNKKLSVSVVILIFCSLLYNIPYWTVSDTFFGKRFFDGVPQYWVDAAGYLNTNLDINDKVLVLPAVYIMDIYAWENRSVEVGGSLLDQLSTAETYRLSPLLIGDARFQKDSAGVFVADSNMVRKKVVDYSRLSQFVKMYDFNYVVLTKDIYASDYQQYSDVESWLSESGFLRVRSFGLIEIYRNDKNKKQLVNIPYGTYEKINNAKYILRINNLQDPMPFYFSKPFSEDWKIYSGNDIFSKITDALYLFRKPVFESTHKISNIYGNGWNFDPEYIKKNFPKDQYRENSDGSIDLDLILYFKSQSYFYLSLIVSGVTFIGSLGYLSWRGIRQSRLLRRKKEE